jgi:hypothetical protein
MARHDGGKGRPAWSWVRVIAVALDAVPVHPGADSPALHVGRRVLPLALKAKQTEVPSLESLEQYRFQVAGSASERRAERDAIDQIARLDRGDDPLLGFLRRSVLTAYESSRRLEQLTQPSAKTSKIPELRSGEAFGTDCPDHQGGLRHADLLHLARRLRHVRQPVRGARGALERAI